ncbi:MAG: DUF362 domain-containing protein [Candidatus Binatia bacterium]
MLDRRTFLKTSLGSLVAASAIGCRPAEQQKWTPAGYRKPERSPVAILPAASYAAPLEDVVRRGIELFGISVRGLRVVLKPNLVEFDPDGVVNTHPALIAATVGVFRSLGARDVIVAEGPGHRRDTEYLLDASGLESVLRDTRTTYVDLNTDVVRAVPLPSRYTELGTLHLPETALGADLLVSMPKLKTHHWAGVTLSLKNMFGLVPGTVYGWPKNVLHWRGIENSILDINAALAMRRFQIVDAVVGMEGNGPIQGDAKRVGALVFGEDPVAVDATCARLMRIDPARVPYLAEAGRFLGNIEDARIEQLGEPVDRYAQDFRVLEQLQGLKLRAG